MFDFLFSSFRPSKLEPLPIVTDIHTHLLPGVDDGFPDERQAREMLFFLQERGVKRIYFTPHIMVDYTENRSSYLKELFSLFIQNWEAVGGEIVICLAAEYMLDEGFHSHLKEGLLTYDSRHVLVELSCQQRPLDLFDKLYNMQLDGYIPILAHPERYGFLGLSDYQKLKQSGCRFQLNLFALSGLYGKEVQKRAQILLNDGFYDYLGSDMHSADYMSYYQNLHLKKDLLVKVETLIENNNSLGR